MDDKASSEQIWPDLDELMQRIGYAALLDLAPKSVALFGNM